MFKNMSTQSILSGISYGIIYMLYLFRLNKFFKLSMIYMIIGLVIGVGLSALVAYDVNCLTTGQCTTWSWIRTVSLVSMTLLILIGTFRV